MFKISYRKQAQTVVVHISVT